VRSVLQKARFAWPTLGMSSGRYFGVFRVLRSALGFDVVVGFEVAVSMDRRVASQRDGDSASDHGSCCHEQVPHFLQCWGVQSAPHSQSCVYTKRVRVHSRGHHTHLDSDETVPALRFFAATLRCHRVLDLLISVSRAGWQQRTSEWQRHDDQARNRRFPLLGGLLKT